MTLKENFEQFVKERQYLKNVTSRTIEYYWDCFRAWERCGPDPKDFVVKMRDGGARASTVNCVGRGLNAYFKWASIPHKIPRLKEEERVLAVFNEGDIKRFVYHKPKRKGIRRAHILCLLLIDTGLRIDEALSLHIFDIDFEQLILKVHGKGNRERYVPFSNELRKFLWQWKSGRPETGFLFTTRNGSKLGHRNITRDVKTLCEEIGVKLPRRLLHSFRHSFATNYLRRGGNVFMLQRVLGHRSIQVTQKYIHFVSQDLVDRHQSLSMLTRA